jgi:two-component system nitrate/nitrite response regulator NarL
MNVLLCDDHVLFCEALSAALVPEGHLVETAFRPEDAIARAMLATLDTVVMDLNFPDGDAIAAIRTIVERSPQTSVVVLTATMESHRLLDALRAGAAAVCSKSQRLTEIVSVIQRTRPGVAATVPTDVVLRLLRRADRNDEHALAGFLTPREYEVLRRLVQGQSTQVIAAEMGVSYSTSRTHIQNVLVKLGVHSRLAASAFAVRNHLVDDDLGLRVFSSAGYGTTVTDSVAGPVRSDKRAGDVRDRVSDRHGSAPVSRRATASTVGATGPSPVPAARVAAKAQ